MNDRHSNKKKKNINHTRLWSTLLFKNIYINDITQSHEFAQVINR